MLGAVIGDIIGSRFETDNIRSKEFELFHKDCRVTDDSIMTLAVAKAIMETEKIVMPGYFQLNEKYEKTLFEMSVKYMQEMGRRYPEAGYGGMFIKWIFSDKPKPYRSFGNGSAMRISAAGLAARTISEAKMLSKTITETTHNHEEGSKGAEATAVAVFMAKSGYLKEEICESIEENYYSLNFMIDDIRSEYVFSTHCGNSVPQAIKCFLESCSFEDAIRTAISIGGDSDTIAAITGSIAGAYYGIPDDIKNDALEYLDSYMLNIYEEWERFVGNTEHRFDFLTKYIGRIEQKWEEEINNVFAEEFRQFMKKDLSKISVKELEILSEISTSLFKANTKPLKEPVVLKCLKKLRDIDIKPCTPTELCFSIGGFGEYDVYHMLFIGERAVMITHKNDSHIPEAIRMTVYETQDFLSSWNDLNIHYYRSVYPQGKNYLICDGTQWLLSLHYEEMRSIVIEGDNNYPTNWDLLLNLFGLENEVEKEKLIYLSVSFEDNTNTYYYLTDDEDIEPGDLVDVPVGNENVIKKAVVVRVEFFDQIMVPYPVNKMKKIVRRSCEIEGSIYSTQGLLLCDTDTEMAHVYVNAIIHEGCLFIKGQDIGKGLIDLFGEDEYEYIYKLNKENTEKLLDGIGNNDLDRIFFERFSGTKGCLRFRKYCEINKIEYEFHTY